MHASSVENMRRCHQRFITPGWLRERAPAMVLDVGGADVNGSYRELFADPRYRYLTVDVASEAGVDIVLEDPYRFPVENGTVDIVVSGQMLEHCEYFWLTFAEMLRVLKPDGYLFLIAPSAGPIHRYPVDCYRFNPDAYRALAKFANCRLVEAWLDERGPWHDLVGVFTKHALPLLSSTDGTPCAPAPLDPNPTPCGSAAEEATRGSVHYLEVLEDLHRTLRPSLYLEIGVRQGRSLALAQGPAVGVDPAPDVVAAHLGPETRVFSMTSDDFFAEVGARLSPQPPGLVFIDGMHLFEYALRDFMNVERLATAATVVVIDDIYPSHPTQALRQRRSRVWTGDIWKLHRCLAEVRPDLFLLPLDAAPAGLLLVAALDPPSRVLWDSYNPIVRHYGAAMPPPPEVLSRSDAIAPADRRVADVLAVLSQARGALRDDLLPLLRTALAGASA